MFILASINCPSMFTKGSTMFYKHYYSVTKLLQREILFPFYRLRSWVSGVGINLFKDIYQSCFLFLDSQTLTWKLISPAASIGLISSLWAKKCPCDLPQQVFWNGSGSLSVETEGPWEKTEYVVRKGSRCEFASVVRESGRGGGCS